MAPNDLPPHPLDHIDSLKCYEWMLSARASAEAQRQAREDGLIATVTQISSAAILAVPGFLLASNTSVPEFWKAPAIYLGIFCFAGAMVLAMLEQHLSGLAYSKQIDVIEKYYTRASHITEDFDSRRRVRRARLSSYLLFGLALALTMNGLLTLKG